MNTKKWVLVTLFVAIIVVLAIKAFAAGGTKSVEYTASDPSGIQAIEMEACCDGQVQPVSRIPYNGETTVQGSCKVAWENYGSVSVKVRAIDNSPQHNPTPWQELIADIPDNEPPTLDVRWGQN